MRAGEPLRYGVELVVFVGATAALWALGQRTLAIVFAAAALLSGVLTRVLGDGAAH